MQRPKIVLNKSVKTYNGSPDSIYAKITSSVRSPNSTSVHS